MQLSVCELASVAQAPFGRVGAEGWVWNGTESSTTAFYTRTVFTGEGEADGWRVRIKADGPFNLWCGAIGMTWLVDDGFLRYTAVLRSR